MTPLQQLILAIAGIAGGVVGTAGGITSLISYPILLAVGLHARAADMVNIAAVAACWPGALLASGSELRGTLGWLSRWVAVAVVGGVAGSLLLLSTPPGVFGGIVPFLVLLSAGALMAEPAFQRRRSNGRRVARPVLPLGVLATSLYGGYFGAGSGVMILTLLLVCVEPRLARANALKNMLVGGASVAGATVLTIRADVRFDAVIPLAIGLFLGALLGPRAARVLPVGVLRGLIVLVAIGLAVELWLGA